MLVRQATIEDLPAVRDLVDRAFGRYVERIGRRPGPMDGDYEARVAAGQLIVAERDGIAGLVVLVPTDDHLLVDTVAVAPERQGTGLGRLLLEHAEAEARRRGLAEMQLDTNVAMTENRALYPRLGFRETGRSRSASGFERVHFAKPLTPAFDVERLLARIGLAEPPAPDLDGLRRIHRAYLGRMPYETLGIHLKEVLPLDLERLAARVLASGRGG